MKAHNFIGAIDECHDKSGWLGYIGTSTVQSCCTPDCRGAIFPLPPEIWLSEMVWNRRHYLESCWTTQHYYQDEIPPSFFWDVNQLLALQQVKEKLPLKKGMLCFILVLVRSWSTTYIRKWLKDISTLDFSTPSFNSGLFNPRLFNHELLNPRSYY